MDIRQLLELNTRLESEYKKYRYASYTLDWNLGGSEANKSLIKTYRKLESIKRLLYGRKEPVFKTT